MYTEEEARGIGCPLSIINMKVKDPGCAGSKCMAWRWVEARSEWIENGVVVGRGYCGLAGKPE